MIEELSSARHVTHPAAQAAHRRQAWLQIYLPVAVGVLAVGALATGLWLGGIGSAGVWADVALVLLLGLGLVIGLLGLGVAVGLLVVAFWAIRALPPQAARLQQFFRQAALAVRRGADTGAAPLLTVRAAWGAAGRVAQGLASVFRK